MICDKVEYVPVDPGGYKRLVDASGKQGRISFIPLAQDKVLILACLDGRTWEEVVPRDRFNTPVGEHVGNQLASEVYKQGQLDAGCSEMRAQADRRQGR